MTKRYYVEHRVAILHRQFFKKIAQNKEYIENFCNVITNVFQFARLQRFYYNNPQFNRLNRFVFF